MARSLPQPLLARLTEQFGPQTVAAMVKSFGTKRLPTLRVNTLKTTDHAVMDVYREEGIAFERIKNIPHALRIKNRTDDQLLEHHLTKNGHVYLQGIASMIPPLVMNPLPGQSIADICAAPGSKTSEIAALMENKGTIIAAEDNSVRYQKLINTITIQGANVDAKNTDSATLYHEYPETFDAILADVPCTAEGRIDLSDPRSFTFWSQKNITEHAKLQRRLLRSAYKMLKPGGTLLYSTCTLAPEENENQIKWFIEEHPSMKVEKATLPISLVRPTPYGTIILPSPDCEGFFVAKLKRLE
jgi:NOL1/NOP2/sun family putative RNA methylase